jgi:hypothetical protein
MAGRAVGAVVVNGLIVGGLATEAGEADAMLMSGIAARR